MGNFIAKANNLTELVINDGSFIKLSNKCKAHMILFNYDVDSSIANFTTKFTGSIYSDTKLSKIWTKCNNKFVLAYLNPDIKVISKKLDTIHKNIAEFNKYCKPYTLYIPNPIIATIYKHPQLSDTTNAKYYNTKIGDEIMITPNLSELKLHGYVSYTRGYSDADEFIGAFMHSTYHYSNKTYIIVPSSRTGNSNSYRERVYINLKKHKIYMSEGYFIDNSSELSEEDKISNKYEIVNFFMNHKCNEFCNKFDTPIISDRLRFLYSINELDIKYIICRNVTDISGKNQDIYSVSYGHPEITEQYLRGKRNQISTQQDNYADYTSNYYMPQLERFDDFGNRILL